MCCNGTNPCCGCCKFDDPRQTRALRLVEEKDGYLHLSGNADDVGIGDFVLDAAGHLIGLVVGASPAK